MEAFTEAGEVLPQENMKESASQLPSDPLQVADEDLACAGTQAAPTTEAGMQETVASPHQSASEAAHVKGSVNGSRQSTVDSNDPKDPYSIRFKLQPWPFKTISL